MMATLEVFLAFICLPLVFSAPFDQLVTVGYYAESLCPDCIAFSTKHMDEAIEKIGNIFTLKYVPWGNAKLIDGKFECQHGEMECIVNTIDACLLKYYPKRYVTYLELTVAAVAAELHDGASACMLHA